MRSRQSRLDPYKPFIDQTLRADLDAPRKQRHTVKRIFDRLVSEHETGEEVSYQMVRAYVSQRRPEVWALAGRGSAEGFISQRMGVEDVLVKSMRAKVSASSLSSLW